MKWHGVFHPPGIGHAEHHQGTIANELVDNAAIFLRRAHHPTPKRRNKNGEPLRIHSLCERG